MKLYIEGDIGRYYVQTLCLIFFPGAGFSEREMKEKSLFPFTLTYAPTADGTRLQVVSIETDTILGKGRLTRQ